MSPERVERRPCRDTFAPSDAAAWRGGALTAFLTAAGWAGLPRRTIAGDASFRRYERIAGPDGRRAVLMDAPPPEDVRPFVHVAGLLQVAGYSVPRILAADPEDGFLLIEDLGDATFTREIAAGRDETTLYALAVDLLADLHRRPADIAASLPPYDAGRLLAEVALLPDWFLPAATGAPVDPAVRAAWLDAWRPALAVAAEVPAHVVLRDFHVDNLMRLDRPGVAGCGLLDFQDAVRGPVTYDLVSLLEDARRDVPAALAGAMRDRYLAAFPSLDRAAFARSYAILGAQRSAKIVGIFTRLDRRDGKPAYLGHIPRVWRWLEGHLDEPALAGVATWLDTHLPEPLRTAPPAAGAGT